MAVWNPQTNQVNASGSGELSVRSGDGSHVYFSNGSSLGVYPIGVYTVNSQTFTTIGSGPANSVVVAVNGDGSQLVLGSRSMSLYDQNLNLLGNLPGTLPNFGAGFPLDGGVLFSADGKRLYEIGVYNGLTDILTIDASSLKLLGTAPSWLAYGTATPFAVDPTGMVLGLQTYGISFDDSTFYQNYAVNQPSFGTFSFNTTYAGPLAGGTVSSVYVFPTLTPDVWFGQTRGSVDASQNQLTFTSPPSPTPGPVNVKFIYPNGEQQLYPQFFSYSTVPQYAVTSGSGPDGGGAGHIIGYGLPQDPSGGTLMVGPNAATITTMTGQYPPFSGEPFPSTVLNYIFPPGAPGWADIKISTPIGTGTLPKSVFYAKSVTDYPSSDSFAAVLVDEKRKQVYLSAGDHVDVFSTSSNQFMAPLNPAAQGAQKEFTGLALTPDGSRLLVADLLDGSLAVINPDAPSNTYAIPIASAITGESNCKIGPFYVAATSTNLAFVTTGGLPGPNCWLSPTIYLANLLTGEVTRPLQCINGSSADASGDGNHVAIGDGPCVYSAQNSSYTTGFLPSVDYGIAISADGNVIGSNQVLADLALNMLGSVAHPTPLYGNSFNNTYPQNLLLRPRLNASGSLYYFAYSNYFEIVDVAHATLRMRFALTETVQNIAAPLAIDSGGRHVYLLTDKGLTVVDLGAAPLSIGHISQQSALPGSQIVVRGSGFDSNTTATVGGVAASVSISDENTLTLAVPGAAPGPQDIVLTNGDGEIYTLENGMVLP